MNFIKKAEKNVVNTAKELSDSIEIFKALSGMGNMIKNEEGKNKYFDGLSKMRTAIYEQYIEAISNCFIFAGVGGKEAQKFSRELFKKRFNPNDRIVVMNFLEKWGHVPRSWKIVDEKILRDEAMQLIEEYEEETHENKRREIG